MARDKLFNSTQILGRSIYRDSRVNTSRFHPVYLVSKGFKVIFENENFKLINEAYPRIGTKLVFFWGYTDFKSYINDLLYDTRGGSREGFPEDILQALFALSLEHERKHAELIPKQVNVWNQKR